MGTISGNNADGRAAPTAELRMMLLHLSSLYVAQAVPELRDPPEGAHSHAPVIKGTDS